MLVLSRKCGERIVVPEQAIVLTVLEVRGTSVRVGIEAPAGVLVFRQEVWQRIKGFSEPLEQPIETDSSK